MQTIVDIGSQITAVLNPVAAGKSELLYPTGALLAAAAYAKKGKMKLMYKLLLARMKKRRIGNAGILIIGLLLILLTLGAVYGIFYFFAAGKILWAILSGVGAVVFILLMLALSNISSNTNRSYY
ncbi:MAG: hypothetical protein ACK4E8_07295 [Lacibacter sp.]